MINNDLEQSILWEQKRICSPVDHTEIRFGSWQGGSEPPAYGVFLINGRGEWMEKYGHIPLMFGRNSKILWLSLDHRGQGYSDGHRAHVRSYEDYARDVCFIANLVFRNLPFYILAHSMGGLISMVACMELKLQPRATFLCSPLFRLPRSKIPKPIVKSLSYLATYTGWGTRETGSGAKKNINFRENSVSHSYTGYQRYRNSPYPKVTPSFNWVYATLEAIDTIFSRNSLEQLNSPVFIMFGSQENVVDPSAYSEWCSLANKYSDQSVKLIKFHGARHELLNEIPRITDLVVAHIKFLIQKFPPK